MPSLLEELVRVDEPSGAREYADALTQVAAEGRHLIVRRNGADLAAIIPLEHLETLREALAREELEQRALAIDWQQARTKLKAPPEWLEGDEPKPF